MKGHILVIGGAGFIGSHTYVALKDQGYEPIIVDDFSNAEHSVLKGISKITGSQPKLYEGDCKDVAFMKSVFEQEKDICGVIHFAAHKAVKESVDEPLKYYDNNINALIVVMRLMQEHGVKDLVYSSSCCIYGEPESLPVTEETPKKDAACPYGTTKKVCEDIMNDTVKSGAPFRIVALRYFNPIGAHESGHIGELPIGVPENLIPFVTQTAAGLREKLTVFGNDYDTPDGTCVRDYIHVMDLADAHIKALEYLHNQTESFYDVFNVGKGSGDSILDVLKIFEEVSGVKVNYEFGNRREGDIIQIYANVDKANTALKWKAQRSLRDALADAWNWQKNIPERS